MPDDMNLSVHRPYASPSLRFRLLRLLEAEGFISQKYAAEALGISRMTANRFLTQLTDEGLLKKKHGADPISGRRCDLWHMVQDPPLLMTDLHASEKRMAAFYAIGNTVHSIHPEYRYVSDDTENLSKLMSTIEFLWPKSSQALHIQLAHDIAFSSKKTCIFERDAIAHALCHIKNVDSFCSLLYVSIRNGISGQLYVRRTPRNSWFSPTGCHFVKSLDDLPSDQTKNTIERLMPFLQAYTELLIPEIILLDTYCVDLSVRSNISVHSLPHICLSENHSLELSNSTNSTRLSPCFMLNKVSLPLWVFGVMAWQRELRWGCCLAEDSEV
ncbi:MAG: winged helix-turn-helix transcriptional regulator [Ruminococcaceae bacterium]|nr:winged helix-turn-helix transcriptional regulator [Oscillospiraceae bacterium]